MLNAVAGLLNERSLDRTTTSARARSSRTSTRPSGRSGSPSASASAIVRILRDYDAAAVEEVFSDGLLNVMEAPEFAQSDKLRQVFSALENRAYLGELVGSVAGSGGVQRRSSAPRTRRRRCTRSSLVLAPYGRPGRAIGVVGVLGPTRMAYPKAIGTVASCPVS